MSPDLLSDSIAMPLLITASHHNINLEHNQHQSENGYLVIPQNYRVSQTVGKNTMSTQPRASLAIMIS
jgi:hypothetical protein